MKFITYYLALVCALGVRAEGPSGISVFLDSSVAGGSSVQATIDDWTGRCEATVEFSNRTFLPITWIFSSIGCADSQVAQFTLPLGVPVGPAILTWFELPGSVT